MPDVPHESPKQVLDYARLPSPHERSRRTAVAHLVAILTGGSAGAFFEYVHGGGCCVLLSLAVACPLMSCLIASSHRIRCGVIANASLVLVPSIRIILDPPDLWGAGVFNVAIVLALIMIGAATGAVVHAATGGASDPST